MALSTMKKQSDSTLLKSGRPILNLKKDTIGIEYDLLSGPLGTKVRVYKDKPEEHQLMVPKKGTKVMSKQGIMDYVKTGAYAEDSSIPELMRKQNISKAQQEDVKKIKDKK
jgi:hypothetical protein